MTGRGERPFTLGLAMAGGTVEHPRDEDVALLLHTSGTTSRPKVVPLRQANLAASMRAIIDSYQLGPEDVSHCVMPLFHVHGLVASTLADAGIRRHRARPAPVQRERVLGRHARAWSHLVLGGAHHSPGPEPARRAGAASRGHALRFGRSCSAALAPTLQARVEELFELPLLQAYGMTEAAHQMATNPLPPAERRPGSVGRATGVEIALFDEEWNRVDGATGEVAIRGRSVVDGYRDNPEANETSFRDGWFRTGDVGRVSSDGYLTLAGRIKELINRGGEKISPFEVEEALLAHPASPRPSPSPCRTTSTARSWRAAVVTRGPVDGGS